MRSLTECRTLLMEDDYYLALDACEWLKEAGADVVGPVASAKQAMTLIEEGPVDAAVLDINLSFGPDFSVARHLREQ